LQVVLTLKPGSDIYGFLTASPQSIKDVDGLRMTMEVEILNVTLLHKQEIKSLLIQRTSIKC
jgi:hypothetical protein